MPSTTDGTKDAPTTTLMVREGTEKRTKLLRVGFILMLAVGAVVLWLLELVYIIGWSGLRWVEQNPLSTHAIGGLLGVAMGMSATWEKKSANGGRRWRLGLFVGCVWGLSMMCLELARVGISQLYSVGVSTRLNPLLGLHGIGIFLVPFSILVFAAGASILLRTLFGFPWIRSCGSLVLGLTAVIPASLLTIKFIPALDGSTDFIHAIKMGYPAFWVIIFSSTAELASARGS